MFVFFLSTLSAFTSSNYISHSQANKTGVVSRTHRLCPMLNGTIKQDPEGFGESSAFGSISAPAPMTAASPGFGG